MIVAMNHLSLTRGLKTSSAEKARGDAIVPTQRRRRKGWMEELMPDTLQLMP
jgi:hypothetical protein